MTSSPQKRTVFQEIKNILPRGSDPAPTPATEEVHLWSTPPRLPTDLFAVAAHLIRVSGLIGWFDPALGEPAHEKQVRIDSARREVLLQAAQELRNGGSDLVAELWKDLVDDQQLLRPRAQFEKHQNLKWCRAAIELLIIADEATGELKRREREAALGGGDDGEYDLESVIQARNKPKEADKGREIAGSALVRRDQHPPSITLNADTDVVCVLPKGRVAQVGCTLRGLSKNLALLPARSSVRAQWSEPGGDLIGEDEGTLDILLVPFPYRLDATSFKIKSVAKKEEDCIPWGNFELKQDWLRRPVQVVKLVDKLIKAAGKQTTKLNGVIFPEFALDWGTFDSICAHIHKKHPSIEFVIAGSSVNCDDDPGNHVLTAVLQRGDDGNSKFAAVSRRKHHRWRLTPDQLRTYGLTPTLNPGVDAWWETHDIGTRELYFHRFRKSSIFVAMICEDLARDDPCHEILRSVGPNIVFALLMDGPQLPARWGARYAGGLADDPGSSVLTFTSWGMIKRANEVAPGRASRTVAMWKDDTGDIHELPMPTTDENSGILLSLAAKEVTERTIDGRQTKNWSWRFNGQYPVVL